MAIGGLIAKIGIKLGWKGIAMGSTGLLGGLFAGSFLGGGGSGGGPLSPLTDMLGNLGSIVWIALGLGVALLVISVLKKR